MFRHNQTFFFHASLFLKNRKRPQNGKCQVALWKSQSSVKYYQVIKREFLKGVTEFYLKSFNEVNFWF